MEAPEQESRRLPNSQVPRLLSGRRDLLVDTNGETVPPSLLFHPFQSPALGSAAHVQGLLITPNPAPFAGLANRAPIDSAVLGLGGTPRSERSDVVRDPDLIVATPERLIDHLRRENVTITRVHRVVIEENSEDPAGYYTDIQYILSKIRRHPRIVLFAHDPSAVPTNESAFLRRPVNLRLFEEEEDMGSYKHIDNSEELKKQVEQILHDIHNEEDPVELNEYKKFFKKNVPIWRRAYFTAYMLKALQNGTSPKAARNNSRRSPRSQSAPAGNNGSRTTPEASNGDEGEMTSVFIGIGKNRRVFPRDLIALFTEVDGITGEDIGQIKILDNYSFMEIKPERAKTAIDSVNGREFRGRKLTVNYARKKD